MKRIIIVSALLCVCVATLAQNAPKRWAVVDFSANFMREDPDYAAELGDQALMGTVVEILGEDSYWKQIVSPEPYKAWVNDMGLVEMSEAEKDAYIAAPKYICTANVSHIWTEPSVGSDQLSEFLAGDLVLKCLSDKGKPISRKGFLQVSLPSGKQGWVLKGEVEDFASWTASRTATPDDIIETAMRFLGVPYMWGGTSIKNVDCSGLSRSVYFLNGILLPRNASQQVKVGEEVLPDEEHLQRGDLLFFGTPATAEKGERITHVGIYIGEGMYIHSSQVVRINSIDPASARYSGRSPLRARRIIGQADAGTGVVSIARSPFYFKQ